MDISVIGTGYVGLVTGAGLASQGHKVVCIDTDRLKVSQINQGKPPFYEPELDELVSGSVKNGNLKATLDYEAISNADIVFVCVNTPSHANGDIGLKHVIDAVTTMGQVLVGQIRLPTIVIKSTVIPGTTEGVIIPILEKCLSQKAGVDFAVAVNPEFLQEGKAVHSFFYPDRIVIGELDCRAGDVLQELYSGFPAPILRTDLKTAEMIKYASNVFLAARVSLVNEIGNICRKLGIDVYEVAKGIGYDPRIGNQFLNAGIGFGGSCFPKDLKALIAKARELGYEAQLLQAVLDVNKKQPLLLVEIAQSRLGSLKDKVVAVLGLAFKPGTDDIREAPALSLIARLLSEGAVVKVYDPKAMPNTRQVMSNGVKFCASAEAAIGDADCVLLATEWEEFNKESLYKGKVVIDGRRSLDPKIAREICEHYEGVCW